MKRLALLIAIGMSASFSANAGTLRCDIESDYEFTQQGRTLVFSRNAPAGKRILIQDGRLLVDGRELALSSADRQRVGEFENEMRLLIPQVRQVSTEAVDMAFTALIEVSQAFNGERDNPTVKKLQNARIELRNSIVKDPALFINKNVDDKIIDPILSDFVPDIIAAAIKQTLSVAFSGDERKAREFEKRMDNMGREIETKIEARAKKLEPLVIAMCNRVRNMDRIEDGISVRMRNKEKINLLDTRSP